jgi:hypothetical protein
VDGGVIFETSINIFRSEREKKNGRERRIMFNFFFVTFVLEMSLLVVFFPHSK